MKIFIDTNVYLDFYRAESGNITHIFNLSDIQENLVLCDQGFEEFKRNRNEMFRFVLDSLKTSQNMLSTPFIRDIPEFMPASEKHREYRILLSALISRIEYIKNNPNSDRVYQQFLRLYQDSAGSELKTTDTILIRALKRKFSGNPPYSKGKITIGDELIWEMLLENIRDDLMLISRDGAFKNNFDILSTEFADRTGKKLDLKSRIIDAFQELRKTPSMELTRFEETPEEEKYIPFEYQGIPVDVDLLAFASRHPPLIKGCPNCGSPLWNGIVCGKCGFQYNFKSVDLE